MVSLPPISYRSGGLENAEIRKAVCDILEGGEGAFQERYIGDAQLLLAKPSAGPLFHESL